MMTYCRLKDGTVHVVFSENTEEETVDIISIDQLYNGRYDIESWFFYIVPN
jgi:IS4 transposase